MQSWPQFENAGTHLRDHLRVPCDELVVVVVLFCVIFLAFVQRADCFAC